MSTPDRQQILDAWETMDWLKSLIKPESGTIQGDKDRLLHAIQDLADALPPKPRPTMAEVEWDNDKHRFAEAENPDHGEVIMLNVSQISGKVRIFFNQYGEFYLGYASPENLTPTGRRYTLTEVQE